MKALINILAVATLLFTISFSANAQKPVGDRPARAEPAEMAKTQTADMVEKLNLDEAQAVQVEAINLDYVMKIKAAREKNEGGREAMKAIRAEYDAGKKAELKKVLTEDQLVAYEAMQPKRGAKKGKKGNGLKSVDRPERL